MTTGRASAPYILGLLLSLLFVSVVSVAILTPVGDAVSGSFAAGSGATGKYALIVAGKTGSVRFNSATPTLALNSTSGPLGATVMISGYGYQGTTCNLTSAPAGLFASWTCRIEAGTLTGHFTVAPSATYGSYVVVVQTDAGASDSATTMFTVTVATVVSFTTTTTTPMGPTTTVTTSGTTSSTTLTAVSTVTRPARPCIIATATFGSEVSWAVQFLRNFRDRLVLSTRAGSAFMEVFNAWYYSFSPSVAGFIANNDPIRAPARVLLYPLLGTLGVSAFTYSLFSGAPEFAVVIAGLMVSSLIGLVYLTLPALVGMRALLKRRRISIATVGKVSATLLAAALAALTAGELTGSLLLLAAASSAVVLVCLVSAPLIATLAILRPKPE